VVQHLNTFLTSKRFFDYQNTLSTVNGVNVQQLTAVLHNHVKMVVRARRTLSILLMMVMLTTITTAFVRTVGKDSTATVCQTMDSSIPNETLLSKSI
jgi:hypothetical protein